MREISHSSEAKPSEYFIRVVSRGDLLMYAFPADHEIQAKKYFMDYVTSCVIVGGKWDITLYHRTNKAEGFYAPILTTIKLDA
jgi:hypothetical protein